MIILGDRKFDDIMSKIQGKAVSVNTNLNILQDGLGHVFVEITLDFSHGEIHEEFLVYANESLEFFESLANTTMFALSPPNYSEVNQDKIFMVQLPKPDKAIEAIDIIKNGLSKKSGLEKEQCSRRDLNPGSLTWQARIITKLYYDCSIDNFAQVY